MSCVCKSGTITFDDGKKFRVTMEREAQPAPRKRGWWTCDKDRNPLVYLGPVIRPYKPMEGFEVSFHPDDNKIGPASANHLMFIST